MEDECAVWLRRQAQADLARHGAGTDEGARAGALLSVLGDYEAAWNLAVPAWERDEGAHALYDQARTLKRTVRKLAYGYRFREGYEEAWKP